MNGIPENCPPVGSLALLTIDGATSLVMMVRPTRASFPFAARQIVGPAMQGTIGWKVNMIGESAPITGIPPLTTQEEVDLLYAPVETKDEAEWAMEQMMPFWAAAGENRKADPKRWAHFERVFDRLWDIVHDQRRSA